ncbi:MAG: gamma-glutamylcyclotransferase family protein [Rhodothermus sp.]|nr:gamma-glutamylcyclotransferase family protein [Rhodothermus sp.]
MDRWYFAYGSNMCSTRLEERVGRTGVAWQMGWLKGYTLTFDKFADNGIGYANIQPDKEDIVYGVLYRLSETELQKLDSLEGVPQHYRRVPITVETKAGTQQAVTYIAVKVQKDLRPKRCYLELLIQGAIEHNLPDAYIQRLKSVRTYEEGV